MSMPSYIPALLHLNRPQGIRLASSPSICIPQNLAPRLPKCPLKTFLSRLLQPKSWNYRLQEVIGSLMYYARILDHTLLPAVTYLAVDA